MSSENPARREDTSTVNNTAQKASPNNEFQRERMVEPPYDRVSVLEAQVRKLQEKVSGNVSIQAKLRHLSDMQEVGRNENTARAMEDRLTRIRHQYKEERYGGRERWERYGERERSEEPPPSNSALYRSLSTQSLPAWGDDSLHQHHQHHHHSGASQPSSPPSLLLNYPLYHHSKKPTSTGSIPSYNGPSYSTPVANSTLLSQALGSGGSTSSLGSVRSSLSSQDRDKPKRGGATTTTQHKYPGYRPLSPRYTLTPRADKVGGTGGHSHHKVTLDRDRVNGYSFSLLPRDYLTSHRSHDDHVDSTDSAGTVTNVSETSPDIEVQRSDLKMKKLQKEVLLLEHQLSDKTRSSERHVEELMLLRTELAQERASLAIVQREVKDQAAKEVATSRTAHARQVRELEFKLNQKERENEKLNREIAEVKIKMEGSVSKSCQLKETVLELEGELKREKMCHVAAMTDLHAKVEDGTARVSQLEGSLHQCKAELEGHVIRVEEGSTQHQTQMWQMRRELGRMAEQIQKKDIELTRKSKISSQLQQEVEKMKAELYHGHTSWEGKNSDLKMRLESSEEARENLLQQVTELTRKLTHHSAQIQGQMGALVELEKAGLEIQRLRNTVKKETSERQKMEMAVLKYKGDLERLEGQYKEVMAQKEVSDKRRLEERAGREACEEEGRELRKEVQTLSEDLRVSHQLLRTEAEKREEKERNGEDSLTHLQQELTKRAQQVLEMDKLLQNHQAETTARRLQLERTLSQRQGEVRVRTQEVEDLSVMVKEEQATIKKLKEQLAETKESQKNLFSGSQAELVAMRSKVTNLERKLKLAESSIQEGSIDRNKLGAGLQRAEERAKVLRVENEELHGKVQVLTRHNDSLKANHLSEINRLKEMHSAQLASQNRHAQSNQLHLNQLIQHEKLRQEETSRCRTQVASLSAELSAEKIVAQETREQVVLARTEVHRHQTQVEELKKSLLIYQEMTGQHHQRTLGALTTPTPISISEAPLSNVTMETNSKSETHVKTTTSDFNSAPPTTNPDLKGNQATPTMTSDPSPSKGGIIMM